jgi:hypothetical protein
MGSKFHWLERFLVLWAVMEVLTAPPRKVDLLATVESTRRPHNHIKPVISDGMSAAVWLVMRQLVVATLFALVSLTVACKGKSPTGAIAGATLTNALSAPSTTVPAPAAPGAPQVDPTAPVATAPMPAAAPPVAATAATTRTATPPRARRSNGVSPRVSAGSLSKAPPSSVPPSTSPSSSATTATGTAVTPATRAPMTNDDPWAVRSKKAKPASGADFNMHPYD